MESEWRNSKIRIIGISEEKVTNGTGKIFKIITQEHFTEIRTTNLQTERIHHFRKSWYQLLGTETHSVLKDFKDNENIL